MEIPKKLYHGTCMAFVTHALQNGGNFGPDYDSVSFTPDVSHARMFANGWEKAAGKRRLEEYFGDGLNSEAYTPILLEFDSDSLGVLYFRKDAGADEFYLEKGPVNIDLAKESDQL